MILRPLAKAGGLLHSHRMIRMYQVSEREAPSTDHHRLTPRLDVPWIKIQSSGGSSDALIIYQQSYPPNDVGLHYTCNKSEL